MQIALLRHGKPKRPETNRVNAGDFSYWITQYNSSGLTLESPPPIEAIKKARICDSVVCSDLPRSVESAHALGVEKVNYIEPMYRELGLPYNNFPSPKLPPNAWAIFFRILWFMGYSKNCETLKEGRSRASACAGRLSEVASISERVLLVGHGFINRFIARELLRKGWQGPADPGREYWDFGVYQYAA